MLVNKIMFFLGLAILAVLVIENMVNYQTAFILWTYGPNWMLALFTAILGTIIGFGFRGIIENKNDGYDESDDYDF